jgi:hypothetical protein
MPTASGKKAYEELFEEDLTGSNVKVLAALFSGTWGATSKKRRVSLVV